MNTSDIAAIMALLPIGTHVLIYLAVKRVARLHKQSLLIYKTKQLH